MDQVLTASPTELAERLYAALAEGDRDALDTLLHPEFEGRLSDGMPGGAGGAHHGPEAMRRDGWGRIARNFSARAVAERFLPLADGRLLVTGRYVGSGRRGGGPLDAAFAHLVSVADGRISALEQYTDTAAWVRAASLFRTLTLEVADGVAHVRLNRPDQANTIDPEMTRDLAELATRLAEDGSVRAVLLGGNGPMFTAGGDIDVFVETPPDRLPAALRRMIDDYHRALERLTEIDAPLVVAVRGAAAGGGLGLVCAADVVIAAEDAVFATGYGAIGMTSDGGNSWWLPRLVGLRRAQELYLTGRRLPAAEALDWGLVTQVLPDAEVEPAAAALAARLATGPTRSFGHIRRLLRDGHQVTLRDQLAAERESIVAVAGSADTREGVTAFTEHRRPRFTGH